MTKPFQAEGCAKIGSSRPFTDIDHHCKWFYFVCEEHFRLLRDSDLQYIARTEGTKSRYSS